MFFLTTFILLFYFDVLFTHYHIRKTNVKEEKNPIHRFFYRYGVKNGLIIALCVYSIIIFSVIWAWFTPLYHTQIEISIKYFLIPLFSIVGLLNVSRHFDFL